jgi:macrophage erythroblast attacher
MIDENNYSFDNLKLFCEKKLNNLLLDFFLREKFLETAKNYIDEEKINSSVEYSIFLEIQKILQNLKNKDINEALNWCNTNKSKLTKLNSNIKFKLLKQQFIEIYKSGNVLDAVKLARENFSSHSDTKEISEIMIILAVRRESIDKIPKIIEILSEERWKDLENDFKQVFFQVYSMKSSSPLEVLFQSGLMSLKTPFCYSNKNKTCPVCCVEIGALAKGLPASHHPVSTLICRITGDIMDHVNPPMELPNGQVYSEKVNNKNNFI